MSVVGFDIGNENCAIAVAKRGGIDVLLNDEWKREMPAVVSFGEKQRFFGSAGAAFATTNPKSTISQIKRLIGRWYKDPSLQKDLRLLPFETGEGTNGGVLIHLQYLGKRWTFMPVEILGMLFAHMKQMTEKNLECSVADCVIGIPSYFTDLQRRECLTAACLAGLKPLMLMHDCTAIALGYGIYKTDFCKEGPTNVVFIDIGHSDTQVTVAAFEQGKMTILSHSFDQNLGGRDFDEVLFRHFAAHFKENYNINICSNARASSRLRASCEKLKKVLSDNADAPLSIERLIENKDVNGFITREEFENLSIELLERVSLHCSKAVLDSGLTVDKIHTIELVGSGSRIPAIMNILTWLFRKEPMRTLNGSECVARGCAIRCAMLSATHQVQYQVQESFPYSIGLCFSDDEDKRHPEFMVFSEGSSFPSNKTVPYHGKITFFCQVFYTNKKGFPRYPGGILPKVGCFKIGPSHTSEQDVKVAVKLKLNIHGIVEIEYASNDAAEYKSACSGLSSTAHHDDKKYWKRAMWQSLVLVVSKNLDVLITTDELREALDREHELAEQDLKVERTKEIRNTFESFIYNTRSKVPILYGSVATDTEMEMISKSLQETEEWLYEEGDDKSEQAYIRKLEYLKKLLDPIKNRYKDEKARIEATKALQNCIREYRLAADSLPSTQKKEVNKECIEAEQWLNHLSQLQHSLAKNATPIYCLNAITGITKDLKRRCKHITCGF